MNKNLKTTILLSVLGFHSVSAMGLLSFVALPVNKGGSVLRFLSDYNTDLKSSALSANFAIGLSGTSALLMGIPYRFSSTNTAKRGDLSVLLRQTIWQNDTSSGTDRLAWLGGFIVPTSSNREAAFQSGFVFTHFKNRHEVDINLLYQKALNERSDTGRYDVSWQYRISPNIRSDWGLDNELYTVLEINGRWQQNSAVHNQITAGLSWVQRRWVFEGGLVKELFGNNDTRLILSTRFHF